jgi:hypothetical protein
VIFAQPMLADVGFFGKQLVRGAGLGQGLSTTDWIDSSDSNSKRPTAKRNRQKQQRAFETDERKAHFYNIVNDR